MRNSIKELEGEHKKRLHIHGTKWTMKNTQTTIRQNSKDRKKDDKNVVLLGAKAYPNRGQKDIKKAMKQDTGRSNEIVDTIDNKNGDNEKGRDRYSMLNVK